MVSMVIYGGVQDVLYSFIFFSLHIFAIRCISWCPYDRFDLLFDLGLYLMIPVLFAHLMVAWFVICGGHHGFQWLKGLMVLDVLGGLDEAMVASCSSRNERSV